METVVSLLSLLNKKIPWQFIVVILLLFLVMKMNSIDEALHNHITGTNKKIEKLTDRFGEQNKHFNDRFDRLNNRLDQLYELMLDRKSKK